MKCEVDSIVLLGLVSLLLEYRMELLPVVNVS